MTCPWHDMPVAWRLAVCLRVPSRRTMECRRRRLTCPWHRGSLRALHVPSRRTMERHRRRPTDMPVAALAVAVAARFALQVIPPESLLVEKWNVVVVTHLQHMQTKW